MVYFRSFDQRWAGSLGMTADDTFRKARERLKLAMAHPTATAHQVAGNISRERGWYDDALKEFNSAIALDPNDSWTYADLAYTLIWANRPAEAIAHIETAMRLDPHYPPVFLFYKGLAQFGQDKFQESANTFEDVIRLNPDSPEVGLYLAAAYGKMGKKEDATTTVAGYSATRVRQGGVPFMMVALQGNASSLWFKVPERERLISGLRAAGAPYDYNGEMFRGQRLNAREIDELAFGHRLHGRSLDSGQEHGAYIAPDGSSASTYGDWSSGAGTAHLEGDHLCFVFSSTSSCATFMRNLGGTREKENEYIWIIDGWGFPFSQVQ
jgi:adenylate cyclase